MDLCRLTPAQVQELARRCTQVRATTRSSSDAVSRKEVPFGGLDNER